MNIDITTIGIAMETTGIEKGARALRDAEKASVGAANAADKVSAASQGAASAYDSVKSVVAKLTAEESKHIQKLVDEYKQLGMSRGQMDAYRMAQSGMSKGAIDLAAAVNSKIEAYKREQAELAKTASATRESTVSMLAMTRTGVAAFLGGVVVQGSMAASKAMFDASAQAERLRTMLDFSTGGGGSREIEYLRGVTQRLGLEFNSTATAYGQFQAASKGTALEGSKARDVFESVAKASAVMGLSADQSSGVLLALQQMISKGTVQAEELRGQLGERLPGAFQVAAKAMGVTTGELGKMLEQGQVVADDFLPKFAVALNKHIGDAAEKAAGRLDASVNRVTSAWDRLKQNAGDSGVSSFMAGQYEILADGLSGVSQAMERARTEGDGFFGQMAAGTGAVARFLNPLQAFSYSAIETGNALKQAEAEFAALQKRGDVMGGNIYYRSEMANLSALINELRAAQEAKDKLANGSPKNMNAGVTASGQARERYYAQRAKDEDAANTFRLNQAGVPSSYLKDMAELIRLNQAGVLVGRDYTDALAKQQSILLQKTGVNKSAAAAAGQEQSAYQSLIASIRAKIAANELELSSGAQLTEAQRIRIKLDQDLAAGKVKLGSLDEREVRSSIARLEASDAEVLAKQTINKANIEAAQTREKYLASLTSGTEKLQADIQAQLDATERMGLSKEAVAALDAAKLEMLATDAELQAIKALDRNLDQQTYDALKQQAALYRDLGKAKKDGASKETALDIEKANQDAAKQAEADWKRAAQDIERSLTDGLMRGFESGKDFAKNMRDTVVNMFKTLVLRPIISAVMNPVAGAINGAVSGAVGSAGSSMLTSIGGSVLGNSVVGGMGGLGSGFMSGMSETMLGSSFVGPSASAAGGTIGLGAQIGAVAPYLAAAAAIYMIAKSLDDSGTYHTGGAAQYNATSGLMSGQSGADYNLGFGRVEAGAESIKAVGGIAQALGTALDGVAVAFGQKAGYEIATAFADDTSKDGAWGALRISMAGQDLLNWEQTRQSKWAPREFGDGQDGYNQYLAAVAKDTRQVLLDMDLPGWADTVLNAIGNSPSIDSLSAALTQIGQAQTVFKSFGQYMTTFSTLADSAVTKMAAASGGLGALAGNMSTFVDQFYTDSEKLAVNTANVREAMGKLGFELPATRDEFKALVQAQLALGDAGADTAAGLLGLSGAFASIVPVTEAVTESVKDMTASLDDYISKTARSSTEADRIRGLAAVGNTSALKRLGIPGYASGGYHSGGLRLVGENGPELEVTGPANIISNPVTDALLNRSSGGNARLESLVERLVEQNNLLRAEVRAVVTHTGTSARILKRVTPEGDALQTREVAAV